jgi:hypothetical protein
MLPTGSDRFLSALPRPTEDSAPVGHSALASPDLEAANPIASSGSYGAISREKPSKAELLHVR